MPKFVNAEHRRKWIASQKRSRALKKQSPLEAIDIDEFHRSKATFEKKHEHGLNGSTALNGTLDKVLSGLRVERVRANDKVTQIDRAIDALTAIKATVQAPA